MLLLTAAALPKDLGRSPGLRHTWTGQHRPVQKRHMLHPPAPTGVQ